MIVPVISSAVRMNALDITFFLLLILSVISYLAAWRTGGTPVKIILIYLILILFTSVAAIYLTRVARLNNNLFLFHIYTPLEYLLLALFYRNILSPPMTKDIILFSIPVLIGTSIFFSLFIQKIDRNNSFITIIESTLIIIWALLFFRDILLLHHVTALQRYPLFWINVGILFYFIGSLIIEGMLDYLIKNSMDLARKAYKVGYIFKYILFLLLIAAAWLEVFAKRKPGVGIHRQEA